MNYFYDLPCVLQEKIIDIRDNNMANKIQQSWNKYCEKFKALLTLTEQLYYYDDDYIPFIEISCKKTAEIIEFIDKKITSKNKMKCWYRNRFHKLFINLNEDLIMEEYLVGPNVIYYNRVEKAFNSIITKIDMKHLFDKQPEHFMYM